MTSDHRPNWKNIIIADGVLTVLLFAAYLWLIGAQGQVLWQALTKVLLVAGIGAGGFGLIAKYAWAHPFSRSWFGAPPDLRGRWKGTSKSSFDAQPRDMVLEIRQTLLSVTCTAYGPKNLAEAYSCRILSDRDDRVFKLAYLYNARPLDVTTTNQESNVHQGMTILDLNETTDPKHLVGSYFNTREPIPRKAFITLSWESKTLRGQL